MYHKRICVDRLVVPLPSYLGSLQTSLAVQWLRLHASNAGSAGSTPGSGRSPGEGNDNLLQCACLANPMDRGAWWGTVLGVTESDIT